MEDVRPFIVQGTADALPFPNQAFDLVISINAIHNLGRERCADALREMERVGRRAKYVQVDSWLNDEQREKFERWQLTAATYSDPDGWRQLFHEAGYEGDYYWTVTE
jgi:ubiquinone/menaquinone biosynthesis C-methylase UbiE